MIRFLHNFFWSGLFLLFATSSSSAQIVINEYLSSNTLGLLDENGETSDWIEIYNSGPEPFNLAYFGLSDDPEGDPFEWYFPSTLINPGSFVLVFASGESQRQVPYFWEAMVTRGDVWRYRANTTAPPAGWQDPAFDDSAWLEGPSGFGYGDDDDQTILEPCLSASFRIAFNIDDPDLLRFLKFHMDYDDGYVAWLNGVPLRRENMAGSDDPPWDRPADDDREARLYQGGVLSGGSVSDGAIQAGMNILAVQVHNESLDSDDLTCIPYLTVGWSPFEGPSGRPAAPEVVARLPQLHTGFKLSADGEILTLMDPEGVIADQIDTGPMYSDVSRGRFPDGGANWHYFTAPTPREPNSEDGCATFSNPPFLSSNGGLFPGPVTISLSSNDAGADIRYTTDGNIPDPTSTLYTAPFEINQTSSLRVVAFSEGMLPSRPVTATYFIDDPSVLPTVSFVTEPGNLFDPEYGIYVEENIFEDWERPMHVEFFETNGTPVINQDAGVKLFGHYSRTRPQKSFRLIPRTGYGPDRFYYPILPEKDLPDFDQLVWRNGGNDNGTAHFRDGLMHRIAAVTGVDYLAYRPSRAFVNGEYWGILNIRERMNAEYLADNHGLDPEEINMIKNFWTTTAGSTSGFWTMWYYIEDNDLAEEIHFNHVASEMDVYNYADYQIIEIFAANHDWGTNNIAWWKSQAEGAKWRWILYDTEAGLGLQTPVEENSLARALVEGGSGWPSPTFRTNILRNLVNNDGFRTNFINRFCDHLNTTFAPERTVPMAEDIAEIIAPEIPRHMDRWDRSLDWWPRVQVVLDFLNQRPALCRQFLQEQFSLDEEVNLSLAVEPPGAGRINLTATAVDSLFTGIYFAGVPITLTVEAAYGYTFAAWSDTTLAAADSVVISLAGDQTLTATFVQTPPTAQVVINEINYHSSPTFDPGDWVELHNPGLEELDLSGWIFRDGSDLHGYTFAEGTALPSDGYLVLCSDLTAFTALFPEVEPVFGDLGFGFSGAGELLRVFDNFGALRDSVNYDDTAPWPIEADGLGATLMLLDPLSDNYLPENWIAGLNGGTPAASNTQLSDARIPVLTTRLGRPYPNPCNPRSEIEFSLARDQRINLAIYDLRGRLVTRLADGVFPAGSHSKFWHGLDDHGRASPSGTYIFRLKLEDKILTRKTLLVR